MKDCLFLPHIVQ